MAYLDVQICASPQAKGLCHDYVLRRWIKASGADGKQYTSCFGSITWNKWELHNSEAKIEIYSG